MVSSYARSPLASVAKAKKPIDCVAFKEVREKLLLSFKSIPMFVTTSGDGRWLAEFLWSVGKWKKHNLCLLELTKGKGNWYASYISGQLQFCNIFTQPIAPEITSNFAKVLIFKKMQKYENQNQKWKNKRGIDPISNWNFEIFKKLRPHHCILVEEYIFFICQKHFLAFMNKHLRIHFIFINTVVLNISDTSQ